jgi:hypothetical protein
MPIITVARQIGSGGDVIARELSERLDCELVDRRLIEEIASITDTTAEEVESLDEKGEGRVKFFLRRLLVPEMGQGGFPLASAAYFPEFGLEFPYISESGTSAETTYLDRGAYLLLITTLMQDFGELDKAVIVGRASQVILAEHERAIHIKVVAPFKERCERIMASREMDFDSAKQLVEQHDKWRKLYLHNYHNANWDNPLLYHLTINASRVDIADAVDLVVQYASRLSR